METSPQDRSKGILDLQYPYVDRSEAKWRHLECNPTYPK